MDSKIWSRLPVEVIGNIILLTSDNATGKVWCEATENCATLYSFACRNYFKDFRIHYTDLAASPDEVRRFESIRELAAQDIFVGAAWPRELETTRKERLQEKWITDEICKEVYRHNLVDKSAILARVTNLHGYQSSKILPARYVERLRIDFHVDHQKKYGTEDYTMRIASLPTDDTLWYSLNCLFPHLSNLRGIIVAGVLPQELLNRITSNESPQLTELILRTDEARAFDYPFRAGIFTPLASLNFSDLGRLQQLRKLEISSLGSDEARTLGLILDTLISLKVLTLSAISPFTETAPFGLRRSVSPFTELFSAIALNKFPPTLESLSIMDHLCTAYD